jgi:release factor glutamine methyltransferase
MSEAPTLRDLVADAARTIGGDEARADAEILLAHALDRDRAWLFAHALDAAATDEARRYAALVARRAAGEPVAYITGRRAFWTLDLEVGPGVLIPRPETELLVELALDRLPADRDLRALDLGTGSGAIALAIAKERPNVRVTAIEASDRAHDIALRNVAASGLGNVRLLHGDWFAPVAGERFDVVVSNPPYIAATDPHLARGDLRHEPRDALASGADGLDAIRAIVAAAPAHLASGGWLLLEHGHGQGEAVRALLAGAGCADVATFTDLGGRDRVGAGRRT